MLVSAQWHPKLAGEHINKLELRSLLTALRWRARRRKHHRRRVLHLVDSQVGMGAVNKARSPSRDLHVIVDKINATVLASGLRLVLAHVASAKNPADAPSRRAFGSSANRQKFAKKMKTATKRQAGAHPAGRS